MKESDQMAFANSVFNQQQQLIIETRRNSGYLARQEIEKLKEICGSNAKRLEQYGFKVYSQNDEDGILSEIFRRIGIEKGIFCEIGVENGLECNTLFMIHQGWRGIWLEGNQAQRQSIESKFGSILQNKRLGLGIGYVTPANINESIERLFSPLGIDIAAVDFLSIDIDGMDVYLLEALKFQPKVICIEYNAKFPPPVSKKPVFNEKFMWRGTDYMGSSLNAIVESANQKGYSLVGTNLTGSNAFFVRDDLVKDRFVENPAPEVLYNPPRYYLTFDHYMSNIGHMSDFGPYIDLM